VGNPKFSAANAQIIGGMKARHTKTIFLTNINSARLVRIIHQVTHRTSEDLDRQLFDLSTSVQSARIDPVIKIRRTAAIPTTIGI
jgi:hypothetical protein